MDGTSQAQEIPYLRNEGECKPFPTVHRHSSQRLSAGSGSAGRRTIMICADDYAISRGVGVAIRRLAEAGRISAASCLTAGPLWPEEAALLRPYAGRIDIGLHLSLTYPPPLGGLPKLRAGAQPSVSGLLWQSLLGRIDHDEVAGGGGPAD